MTFSVTKYDKIHYYENVFINSIEMVKKIEDADGLSDSSTILTKWNDWLTSGGQPYQFGMQKRTNERYIPGSSLELEEIVNTLRDGITNVSREYEKDHSIDIGVLMPLVISKYFTGKEMGPHCDNYEGTTHGPVISVVGYLNDDYDGGEIFFREQDVKIKPSAGSIVVFPSNEPFFHQSLPVKSGTKYMCPGFWYKLK